MEQVNLEAGLRSLRESLRQIKALLAWQELKQSETRPDGQLFILTDSVERDLRNEYSFFLAMAVQIRGILNDDSYAIPEEKRQAIKSQLARIENELYSLGLHQKLSKLAGWNGLF